MKARRFFVFDSISRYFLLGRQAEKELQIIRDGLGHDVPIAGIYTFGEQAPLKSINYLGQTYFHNQTITISGMATVVSLSMTLVAKMQKLKEMRVEVDKLKRSLDEMDEQAKLIVRTDMELNKTQEELDKKMTGLYALQRLSRSVSTTLEESQIFRRIDAEQLEDLGFEKSVVFLWEETEKKFLPRLKIGYQEEEVEGLKLFVNAHRDFEIGMALFPNNGCGYPLFLKLLKCFGKFAHVFFPL